MQWNYDPFFSVHCQQIGAAHKRRRNLLGHFFIPPSPMSEFQPRFETPPPSHLKYSDVFYGWPLICFCRQDFFWVDKEVIWTFKEFLLEERRWPAPCDLKRRLCVPEEWRCHFQVLQKMSHSCICILIQGLLNLPVGFDSNTTHIMVYKQLL